jgi:hypothetical protein
MIDNSRNKKYYSKSLVEHTDRGLGIDKCMFRVGSYSFINLISEVRMLVEEGLYKPNDLESFLLENSDLGEWGVYERKVVPLGLPMINEDWEQNEIELMEAEHKGRKVQLGKPKRGGPKKFYVYVSAGKNKDGSTKVKKVSWGDSGMSVKIKDPKRRKSFAARHRCEQQNDRTTAAYWACRTARYPHLTGSKKSYTWW